MARRILMDAAHPREIRMVLMDGKRVEEYEIEEQDDSRPLKGNIYLAQITRVEPSLQAAFVEYGGDRNGFLPFSEIHPDYFQIPAADRPDEEPEALPAEDIPPESAAEMPAESPPAEMDIPSPASEEENGDEALGELTPRDDAPHKKYQIQEVIKQRQILLVQIEKEPRDKKGAYLTTYISLRGQFCVLLANRDVRGISRGLAHNEERRRIKDWLDNISSIGEMGVVVYGKARGQPVEKLDKDLASLAGLWEKIRAGTMEADAPALIHREANLLIRTLRGVNLRDTDEVIIEGEEGWREASAFLERLMPESQKSLVQYTGREAIFDHYEIEDRLEEMISPTVSLKSGGYLVINPTEALIAIDVNSGGATGGSDMQQTALQTNLEAAAEIARQIRIRNLAGLIVVDFIDMTDPKDNREIEECLRNNMRGDHARLQLGQISEFGLLEMARQRTGAGLWDKHMQACPRCNGHGRVISGRTVAHRAMRALAAEAAKKSSANPAQAYDFILQTGEMAAVYMLNHARLWLDSVEKQSGGTVIIRTGEDMGKRGFRVQARKSDGKSHAYAPAVLDAITGDSDESESRRADEQNDRPMRMSLRERILAKNRSLSGEGEGRQRGNRGGRRNDGKGGRKGMPRGGKRQDRQEKFKGRERIAGKNRSGGRRQRNGEEKTAQSSPWWKKLIGG